MDTTTGRDWRDMTPEMFDTKAKPVHEAMFAPDSQGRFEDMFSETEQTWAS